MTAKRERHCQVLVNRSTPFGYHSTIAWIPEQFAVVGKFVSLPLGGDNWKVLKVWKPMDSEFVKGRERDYRTQRSVSDV